MTVDQCTSVLTGEGECPWIEKGILEDSRPDFYDSQNDVRCIVALETLSLTHTIKLTSCFCNIVL